MKIGSEEWKRFFREQAASLDISVTDDQLEAFSIHASELLFWSRRTNLTTITDPKEVAVKHFVDSLVPSRWMSPGAKVLDIGAGAGFPGIPLKVLVPALQVVLIDAVRKKVTFLGHVIRLLGLSDARAVHFRVGRADAAGAAANAVGAGFDVVISRALGAAEALAPLALPLLGENGIIIAMLGKAPPAAAAAGKRIGPLIVCDAFDYRLPHDAAARSLWRLKPA